MHVYKLGVAEDQLIDVPRRELEVVLGVSRRAHCGRKAGPMSASSRGATADRVRGCEGRTGSDMASVRSA